MTDKSAFSGDQNFEYEGSDLDSMSLANNYNNWILDCFDKYIGNTLLEVGAGTGSLSKLILERYKKDTYLLEPSANLFTKLQSNFRDISNFSNQNILKGTLQENQEFFRNKDVDSIFYMNVLEHIKDDVAELKLSYDLLNADGHILTFSPALPQLYGEVDKQVGHYRRYYLNQMKSKMTEVGFKVVDSYYFDFVGMLLWWGKFKLLKSKNQDAGNVKFFDSILVPILKKLEYHKLLPIGKNIVVIGKK